MLVSLMKTFFEVRLSPILVILFFISFLSSQVFASFSFSMGGSLGIGNQSTNDTTTLKERTMYNIGVESNASFSLLGVALGLGYELKKNYQITDPSEVSNSNTEGNLTLLSPTIGYELGPIRLLFSAFPLLSKYSLSQKNSHTNEVFYEDAALQDFKLQYKLSSLEYVGVGYQVLKFSTHKAASVLTKLNSNNEFVIKNISISYGLSF